MPNITVTASAHPQHKDITLLSVKGFIDTTTAPEFEKTFQSVLAKKRFNLIIDLKEVNYISSAGWGIFIAELKRIRNQKGNLFLTSMCQEVTDTYYLLEFHTILKSFPDVEQAVQQGFGKIRAVKGRGKRRTSKSLEVPRAEAGLEEPRVDQGLADTLKVKEPGKSRWFVRMLKPWTWL